MGVWRPRVPKKADANSLAGTEPTEVAPAAGEQDERGFLAHELPQEAGKLKNDPVDGAPTEVQDDPGDTPELATRRSTWRRGRTRFIAHRVER